MIKRMLFNWWQWTKRELCHYGLEEETGAKNPAWIYWFFAVLISLNFAYPGTYLMQSMHYLERFKKIQDGNQGGQ